MRLGGLNSRQRLDFQGEAKMIRLTHVRDFRTQSNLLVHGTHSLTDTQLHEVLSVAQFPTMFAAIALISSEAENGCTKDGKIFGV